MGEGEDKRRPLCHSSRRSTEVRLDTTHAERGNRRDFVILKRTEEADKRKERVFCLSGRGLSQKASEGERGEGRGLSGTV